jgi:hypothetical protein
MNGSFLEPILNQVLELDAADVGLYLDGLSANPRIRELVEQFIAVDGRSGSCPSHSSHVPRRSPPSTLPLACPSTSVRIASCASWVGAAWESCISGTMMQFGRVVA